MVTPNGRHPLARWRRLRQRMTQAELAKAAGCTRVSIARIEGGSVPSVDLALRIAKALDVTVEDIWGDDLLALREAEAERERAAREWAAEFRALLS